MKTIRLRHCNAHVNENVNEWGLNSYELVSYNTPVALYGLIDGGICDTNGNIRELSDFTLLLSPEWDCSVTTISHLRKFIEDYLHETVYAADLRYALKNNTPIISRYGLSVNVYLAEW